MHPYFFPWLQGLERGEGVRVHASCRHHRTVGWWGQQRAGSLTLGLESTWTQCSSTPEFKLTLKISSSVKETLTKAWHNPSTIFTRSHLLEGLVQKRVHYHDHVQFCDPAFFSEMTSQAFVSPSATSSEDGQPPSSADVKIIVIIIIIIAWSSLSTHYQFSKK